MHEHILITGAASGIGAATARQLAEAKETTLFLVDRDAEGLNRLSDELGACVGRTAAIDVSDPEAWAQLALDDVRFIGAVLSAGVSEADMITDMSFAAWRRVLSVNLDGAFLALQTVLRNAADGAAIVAVGSATGRKVAPMTAAYGASKAGLAQLIRVAALEGAPRGIRVNGVAPGGVKTRMFSDQDFFQTLIDTHGGEEGAWAALSQDTPLKRFSEPGEIAALIRFLLSPQAETITGTILNCDGGYGL